MNRATKEKQVFNLTDFLSKAEIPAVPITIDGKEFIIMLDTGSDASYLDTKFSKEIKKKLLGYQEEIISGTGIKEKGSPVYEVEFTCGVKTFTEIFTENDFGHIFDFFERTTGVRLCGILGTRFLMKYKCILDFDKLVFYL